MAGGENLFGRAGAHSPWLAWEDLREADPDVVVFFPCGFSLDRVRAEIDLVTAASRLGGSFGRCRRAGLPRRGKSALQSTRAAIGREPRGDGGDDPPGALWSEPGRNGLGAPARVESVREYDAGMRLRSPRNSRGREMAIRAGLAIFLFAVSFLASSCASRSATNPPAPAQAPPTPPGRGAGPPGSLDDVQPAARCRRPRAADTFARDPGRPALSEDPGTETLGRVRRRVAWENPRRKRQLPADEFRDSRASRCGNFPGSDRRDDALGSTLTR